MSGFASFDEYLAVPRVIDLAMSVDGKQLVATVASLNDEGDKFVNALWEIDPARSWRAATHPFGQG